MTEQVETVNAVCVWCGCETVHEVGCMAVCTLCWEDNLEQWKYFQVDGGKASLD